MVMKMNEKTITRDELDLLLNELPDDVILQIEIVDREDGDKDD